MKSKTIICEKYVIFLGLCFVYIIPEIYGQTLHHRNINSLNNILPQVVQKLKYWPISGTYPKTQIYNEMTLGVKVPLRNSEIWTKDVLTPAWQPPSGITEKLIIHNEAGFYDTIRQKWKHQGFEAQLTQTYTLFMLKLVKLEGKSFGGSKEERITNIRNLASSIFASSYFIRDAQGKKVPIAISQLIKKNFNSKDVKYVDNGSIICHIAKIVEFTPLKGKNYGIAKSLPWYQMISWFNEKNELCFYFLKNEGGATPQGIKFESRYNSTLFEISSRFAIDIACKEANRLKIKYNRKGINVLSKADSWKVVFNPDKKDEVSIFVNKISGKVIKENKIN